MSNGPTIPPIPANVGAWFNPLRRLRVTMLLEYLRMHGLKIYLDGRTYHAIEDELGIDRHTVDLAADDAFAIGCLEMRVSGHVCALILLTPDVDRLDASKPPPAMKAATVEDPRRPQMVLLPQKARATTTPADPNGFVRYVPDDETVAQVLGSQAWQPGQPSRKADE